VKKELIFELSVYVLCILLVAFLWHKPTFLMVSYIVISVIVFFKWHTKGDIFFYSLTFFLGSMGESVAVYFGAWEYSKPFYLIPIWLPLLWGITALFMKNICETLLKRGK
jgi:hypothetical protein